jgi:hypothetical protein
VGAVLFACGGDAEPTRGVYTVQFPSTAAAIATDFVEIFVFPAGEPDRDVCADLVVRRKNDPGSLHPEVDPPAPATNICEMRAGRKPIVVPYGEHALLAVAQRRDTHDQLKDFLVGCAIMSIGNGDAPLPIPLRLVDVVQDVPATKCPAVQDYCEGRCP